MPAALNLDALPALSIADRIDRVRAGFSGIDTLIITHLPNVRYASGFTGSAGLVVLTEHRAWLCTDGRYETQAHEQLAAAGVAMDVVMVSNGLALAEAIAPLCAGVVGFESESISVAECDRIRKGAAWIPTTMMVERVRMQKDDGEVERIAAACGVADAAFAAVRHRLEEGLTEIEFALELEFAMRARGASAMSFEPIVAAGPRGALPHARPSEAIIPMDTLVVCDFGCVVDGYCSDMTRTVVLGTPGRELSTIFEIVADAQANGVLAARAGASLSAVDAATREPITAAGFGEYYVHGTGHGVGLEIHEAPRVGATADGTLEDRTIVTVEPGIYLPGVGGVRIEDTLLVTDGAPRVLTQSPKDSL